MSLPVARPGTTGTGGPTMKLLPEGYCIDTTEVTREQYYIWIASNPVANAPSQITECAWNSSYTPDTNSSNDWPPTLNLRSPIVLIDWCDANAFCKAVGKRLCGKIGGGPILLSEATANPNSSQWINACSAHGANDYVFGDTYVENVCNCSIPDTNGNAKYVETMPDCQSNVPSYSEVFDLSGNVEEWEDNCPAGEADSHVLYPRRLILVLEHSDDV